MLFGAFYLGLRVDGRREVLLDTSNIGNGTDRACGTGFLSDFGIFDLLVSGNYLLFTFIVCIGRVTHGCICIRHGTVQYNGAVGDCKHDNIWLSTKINQKVVYKSRVVKSVKTEQNTGDLRPYTNIVYYDTSSIVDKCLLYDNCLTYLIKTNTRLVQVDLLKFFEFEVEITH